MRPTSFDEFSRRRHVAAVHHEPDAAWHEEEAVGILEHTDVPVWMNSQLVGLAHRPGAARWVDGAGAQLLHGLLRHDDTAPPGCVHDFSEMIKALHGLAAAMQLILRLVRDVRKRQPHRVDVPHVYTQSHRSSKAQAGLHLPPDLLQRNMPDRRRLHLLEVRFRVDQSAEALAHATQLRGFSRVPVEAGRDQRRRVARRHLREDRGDELVRQLREHLLAPRALHTSLASRLTRDRG